MHRTRAPRDLDVLGPLLEDFQLLGDGIERLIGNLTPRPIIRPVVRPTSAA